MKIFLRWLIIVIIVAIITSTYFAIARAEEFSQQSQKSQIQNLRQSSLEMWKYLLERKKEDFKKTVLVVNTELEKKLRRQEEKELDDLHRLNEALELTKYFVSSSGKQQEKENFLVVGYDYYRGELAPVWADFSQELSKLKSFEILSR